MGRDINMLTLIKAHGWNIYIWCRLLSSCIDINHEIIVCKYLLYYITKRCRLHSIIILQGVVQLDVDYCYISGWLLRYFIQRR